MSSRAVPVASGLSTESRPGATGDLHVLVPVHDLDDAAPAWSPS